MATPQEISDSCNSAATTAKGHVDDVATAAATQGGAVRAIDTFIDEMSDPALAPYGKFAIADVAAYAKAKMAAFDAVGGRVSWPTNLVKGS